MANQHQIANSLQIVASILPLKARSVQSQETRSHLENVGRLRIMSVATVQHQLLGTKDAGRIALAPYLVPALQDAGCVDGGGQLTCLDCLHGWTTGPVPATEAVSLGLIVTELVINALKHAFVDNLTVGRIAVTYDLSGDAWCLAVSDNGIGRRAQATTPGPGAPAS